MIFIIKEFHLKYFFIHLDNPNDPEALREMYDAQKEMTNWATSKNKPGQFTGHTGAKILTHAELTSGLQAWAKQDQFTKAQKVIFDSIDITFCILNY